MVNYAVIYSADYMFQVLNIVRADLSTAWNIANEMSENGTFKENKIEHYDVMHFDSVDDMNNWIIEQVYLSRE